MKGSSGGTSEEEEAAVAGALQKKFGGLVRCLNFDGFRSPSSGHERWSATRFGGGLL